jgi:hypothetical protein
MTSPPVARIVRVLLIERQIGRLVVRVGFGHIVALCCRSFT